MLAGGMFEALMANEVVPETPWALTTSLLAEPEFSIFFDDRPPGQRRSGGADAPLGRSNQVLEP
jgi:hypothetical protein